ncbi:hypothetical protein BU23DRAFT_162591 [Bimuria novae-zelandiae CBS 107.79]|uniref:VASt domain-containing protein n=1 Tax=Bimuria novae-zelandiae CBS 107.79 TaxID=1447943 RepID=A0A6A5V8L9_9PLEO|nr:hypothetical protein BU23DRAFT_162591 [Bimuria novae-zelandiae CBS 107.79]
MAAVDRARSTTSSLGANSRDNSLAAPKGGFSSSTTSITSSDGHGDAGSDLMSPGDGALDRRKSRGSEDASSETSSHRRKVTKLFKGRKARRKSMQGDISPGDTTADVPPLPDMPTIKAPGDDARFRSEESLALHKSVTSSLLTEDSDAESSPVRPDISPHQSHAGYLTLSSPLINSETLDSAAPSEPTLIDSTASSEEPPTPRYAKTFDVASAKRGASPVSKLKEAFVPTRRSTSPKPTSDTTEAARPSTSGGLGALFGGKKRDTRLVDDGELQASPPQIQIHASKDTQSASSLPRPGRIFTQIPATLPNLAEAPTTVVTPPTPIDARPVSPASSSSAKNGGKHGAAQPNLNVVVSPSGNMISHRRARSATNPPSRLSNSITVPLTPTIEEAKTPGGTAVPPQSPSGFFSSVFSAAQNAANTLSTTIANSAAQNKNKPVNQQKNEDQKSEEVDGEEVIGPANIQPIDDPGSEKRRLAVETLGSGSLSLAHLGISDSSDHSPMSSTTQLPLKADEVSARASDMAAAQAVSAAYAAEPSTIVNDDRPRSLTATSGRTTTTAGAMSPPRQEVTDSPASAPIQRQGSIRSRISGGRRRRHRGSSATTGNTIAAAIGASTHTLAPQASVSGQRLNGTGFAVASSKRNKDFHALFKSVPEDDYLIEDYSAALQKEILLHGRLYVSEGHLCFSSNILGWVTNLVISFDEVVSVEKKSTAVVFPNAIVIQTLHARNVFASFLTRDATYDLIIGIWKISHPNLKSSLNGVALDGSGTGDKTEKAESIASDEVSDQDSDDEVYDEDEEEDGIGSFTEAGEGSIDGSERESISGETRKASAAIAQAVSGGSTKLIDSTEAVANGAPTAQDFPGAATHAATECGDNDQHYDKLLIDTTIPAPLGKVYSLMFGPASGAFMRKWLIEDQKSTELQLEDDGKGLDETHKTMTFQYIKPLGGGIGPSKTRCMITSTVEQFSFDKAITVLCSTQTPDVPSGNVFLTKTRYCLMWGPNNSTRLVMTFTVEWSGKSWLKGPIEKGANDGQLSYATSLSAALRTAVVRNAAPRAPGKGGKGKKRSKAQITDDSVSIPSPAATPTAAQPKEPSWGPLDPLRSMLPSPLVSILDILLTTQAFIFILGTLLIYVWFFRAPTASLGPHAHLSFAHRQVAYEQIWRSEEAELWKWLEERVALDRVHSAVTPGVLQGQEIQSKLADEGIRERQIDEAIRTTEEKLRVLKGAVRRKRETGTMSPREEQT